MLASDYLVVLCTCPNKETATQLAQQIVSTRLAACVNILGNIHSVYYWQGAVESAQEHLMVIKTQSLYYKALEQTLLAQHPYETPEIIALPVAQGSAHYLAWITQSLGETP
ncbi:MAG: divalent-cation tolerance protein CutA [Gammaproteobacteria bacterium]